MSDMPPLHPKIGEQLLELKGAKIYDDWPSSDSILVALPRASLDCLWAVLHDLDRAAREVNVASAPDLIEALDQLLDDMGDDGLCVCQDAKDQAKAALAKARGEA